MDFTGKVGGHAAGCRITVYHNLGVQGTVEPVAGGLTDRNGEFDLRGVPWFRGGDWAYNYVIVAAQTGDRVGLLQVRRDGAHAGVEIALRATSRVRGVVCDLETGRPIAGASVWPMVFGSPDKNEPLIWPTAAMVPWQASTDAEGRFELVGVPEYGCYVLDVSGPQHGRQLVRVEDVSRPIDVRLAAAGRIVGRVLLANGKPAAGVAVWANVGDCFARARTGTDGRFALESLAGAIYEVRTVVEQGPTVVAPRILVEAGRTAGDVDLRMCITGSVAGRLVDAATGESIATDGTAVVLARGAADEGQRIDSCARIQADGSFRIEVAPGRNKLQISVPGWTASVSYATVGEGEETTLVVQLHKGECRRRR